MKTNKELDDKLQKIVNKYQSTYVDVSATIMSVHMFD